MKHLLCICLLILTCLGICENFVSSNEEPHPTGYPWEKTTNFWRNLGHNHVADKLRKKLNTNRAKNLVFFLGDGMNLATIFAARVALGGEEKCLSFEKFPYTGLSKTYCVDSQVADSACTGTAYMCGVKNNYGTLGVNAQVPLEDCWAAVNPATHTESIVQWALDAGKSAGTVTTTKITDASPAAGYAKSATRAWENDIFVRKSGCDPNLNKDIAYQLIHGKTGSGFSVILGGGRQNFRDVTMPDEEGGYGWRNDSRNLIEEWLNFSTPNRHYVWNREGLLNLPQDTERVLGLFEKDHMQYYLETLARGTQDTEPTLEEMTRAAIKILQKNKNGFYLFVEGGKIDLAHHENLARTAISETVEFHKAIKAAKEMLNEEDTLIVVTADHAHALGILGYPSRGHDIFGEVDRDPIAIDGMHYMTLSYTSGPSNSDRTTGRVNPDDVNYNEWSSQFPSYVPIINSTHSGEDVAVYACGPFAHLFEGTIEQSDLPYLMAHAACIGDGPKFCPLLKY